MSERRYFEVEGSEPVIMTIRGESDERAAAEAFIREKGFAPTWVTVLDGEGRVQTTKTVAGRCFRCDRVLLKGESYRTYNDGAVGCWGCEPYVAVRGGEE